MSENTTTQPGEESKSYFQERIANLGAKKEDYIGVFEENDKGDIVIYYFDPSGNHVIHQKSKHTEQKYARLRLHPSRVTKKTKYRTPKGQPAHPFIPPKLSDKFNNGEKIKNLILVEGEFKAFKASLHGFDAVGLQGIFAIAEHFTNEAGEKEKHLDPWITQIIERCQVENIIFLLDGDCRDITPEKSDPNKDLWKRPNNFYASVRNFKDLVRPVQTADAWFGHIKANQPKGLDDLLVGVKGAEDLVLEAFSTLKETEFFNFMMLSETNLSKVKGYFNISSEEVFYNAHIDLLLDEPFVFKKTKYKHNPNSDKLEVVKAAEAQKYMRVGDTYIKKKLKPNRHGGVSQVFDKILKSTIKEDYPKIPNILSMIDKYEGFVNLPDNIKYEQVISGWWNQYNQFTHEPEPGECATSLAMVKHIFGESLVELPPKKTDQPAQKIPMWEFGLDYIQLLYLKPREFLPILCLVSEENQSGKGTFKNWLRYIFGLNTTEVTIKELDSGFNEGYADKLLIVMDEAFVDKLATKETLKRLSTNETEKINPKGLPPYEIDFFGKFLVLSNNEKNFIPIVKTDDRFWVHKVTKPKTNNVNMVEELKAEVPAFLHFLKKRKMVVPQKQERMWFPLAILKTPAFEKAVKFNRSWLEKAIEDYVKGLFEMLLASDHKHNGTHYYEVDEICLDRKMILNYLAENGYRNHTAHQVSDTLADKFNVRPERNATFEYPQIQNFNGQITTTIIFEKKVNVYYRFRRSQFITQDQVNEYLVEYQAKSKGQKRDDEGNDQLSF
ncbi:hypothetical protein BKI52_02585 [marine bacterium AO1-C]|nr:hypothetical protein BKI52_02585 [marine bacterium AO1-C]